MIFAKPASNNETDPMADSSLSHKEDLELSRRIAGGDERMFNAFFDEYFPRLFRFCLSRMDDENDIEDIVQTTMINALRNMDSYRGDAAMFTWLCQICRNEIGMYYRKRQKSAPEVAADDDAIRPILEQLESVDDLEVNLDALQLRQLIVEVLDFLPTNYGHALEWKYILGLSVAEISQRLDITELATQSLLARARTAFRRALGQISPQLPALARE